ncbi:mRNA cap guanine-N7 methyltransferase [Paramuricea clavata]|uniref:mRNA (guanine-N(7))-methyltransferase n=1 Tax=Paramuricea clavata TaxID=317549 RepID=A0A7D9LP40_PARCT|nr:mRNA cap guanine-N7 methyltransferase [Paramuricea clavata]
MADSEGSETVQMEDATKSLEKDQPEPMDEEQSIAEVQEEAPKGNENGHQTDEAAPEGESKEEPSKDKESSEQTEEATPEVEKEEEGAKGSENETGDEVSEKKETTEVEKEEEGAKESENENGDEVSEKKETTEVEKEEGAKGSENEIGDQVSEKKETTEVEKEEEGAKESQNETGDQVSEKKEETTEEPQQDKSSEDTQQAKSEEPMEVEKGHGATVAKHYNEHKDNTREERKQSPIFYLRNFNNWVKSVLINEFMEKYKRKTYHNLSVLDLACGKGGDLLKWQKARISNLVCADIAEVSMKQCEQRYKDLRYSRNHRRYNQSQKIYDAQFITADCTKDDITDKFNGRNKDVKFDMTSCQFALHYAFESAEQAEKMLQNACERLKPGGYFIGTMPCANEIM